MNEFRISQTPKAKKTNTKIASIQVGEEIYIVKPGDNPSKIADKLLGRYFPQLPRKAPVSFPDYLFSGRPKDNFFKLVKQVRLNRLYKVAAHKFNELMLEKNRLNKKSILHIGDSLKIPKKEIIELVNSHLAYEEKSEQILRSNPKTVKPVSHSKLMNKSLPDELSGEASFYGLGDGFHKETSASGVPFNKNDDTMVANNIFPLGAILRITSESTGKSILVRNVDTGGFEEFGRVVDLSEAAMKKLGIKGKGQVIIKPILLPPEPL